MPRRCGALAGTANSHASPQSAVRGVDAVVVITVTAAVLQPVDIIVRFYQDWRSRQRFLPGSRPQMTIIRPDGTRIDLDRADAETVKALLE